VGERRGTNDLLELLSNENEEEHERVEKRNPRERII
jgi:hypothetical protein